MDITKDEQRQLDSARQAFLAKLQAAPEKHRRAIVDTTAHNMLGNADPFTISLARNMAEQFKAQDRVTAARQELDQIEKADLSGHRPADPDYRGRMLARKDDLTNTINLETARFLGLQEADHGRAMQEAVQELRTESAKTAKAAAVQDAIERIRAERDAADIEKRAAAVVDAERRLEGKDTPSGAPR